MVIASRRQEGGLAAEPKDELEAEHVPVEADRAIEIRHPEMNVSDLDAGRGRFIRHGMTIRACLRGAKHVPEPRPGLEVWPRCGSAVLRVSWDAHLPRATPGNERGELIRG